LLPVRGIAPGRKDDTVGDQHGLGRQDIDRRDLAWERASWLNPPEAATVEGADLLVTARGGSDFWRTTGYGFVRDDGHALLAGVPDGTAVEVTFVARFDTLYDQAGLMVRVDADTWIKAGVELNDGVPHLGAVVTHGRSDWSLSPVPEWDGRPVTVRASRAGDAVTVRARAEGEAWRTVRLAPFPVDATAAAGPYCCSPQRAGGADLQVRFTGFTMGPADTDLHEDPDS
jgi:regulation of enolase protein 1 (concanavalin A-like superfamily)